MPKIRDLGKAYAPIGIKKDNLFHARDILLAQNNTTGYASSDPYHDKLNTRTATYSAKAQRSGKTYDSSFADTLRPSKNKFVDTIGVNTPVNGKAKREQEGDNVLKPMDKSNLGIAGGLALLGWGLTSMY
jgi:hypothetical protein